MSDPSADEMSSLRDKFTFIFKENRWGHDESVSGAGSALSSSSVRDSAIALDEVIRRFGVRSIIDTPCGDFYWIPLILGRFPYLRYQGFDIVADLIDWNRQRFPYYDFGIADVTSDVVPQADLIFCKDLLLHLGNVDNGRVLRNFKRSGCRYLLITTEPHADNTDVLPDEIGSYRTVNLKAAPYDFPAPIWSYNYLSLWDIGAMTPEFFDDLCVRLGADDHRREASGEGILSPSHGEASRPTNTQSGAT